MRQPLDDILKHPAVWRIGQMPTSVKSCIPTGYPTLDDALAYPGWTCGEMTEILSNEQGIGELLMLVPALRHQTQAGRNVVLVAPPFLPFPSAWESHGIRLDRIVVIHADGQERLWATEQAARSGACGMVITWGSGSRKEWSYPSLRRLQVAADHGRSVLITYRPANAIQDASPAPTRLLVSAQTGELQISVAKQRGAMLAKTICLNLHVPHWQIRTTHYERQIQHIHSAHETWRKQPTHFNSARSSGAETPVSVLATTPLNHSGAVRRQSNTR